MTEYDRVDQPKVFASLTAGERRGITASYYTSLSYLIARWGGVPGTPSTSQANADDTIVVYLGDNGYLLGEHGRFEKHCFYETRRPSPR